MKFPHCGILAKFFRFDIVGNTESTHHSLQPKVVRQNTVNNSLYPHGPAFGKTSQDDSFGFTKSHKLSNLYARAIQAFIQPIIFVMMTLEGEKKQKIRKIVNLSSQQLVKPFQFFFHTFGVNQS